MVFWRKNLEISQTHYMWQIFSTMRLIWCFFLKISFYLILNILEKYLVGKIENYDEQTAHFEKKNAFVLPKGIINNEGGRKKSRSSRVSFLNSF